ncbi:hypothetical protein DN820_01965 [Stutzerimonas nosocomialis]|uniref:DUF2802 domain-containing protein n=1 Tax=Stutzerimonas nosocomialis TaxID=1056496 RepID=A0A5R9QJ09_9GAMM|nr:hypothetical protein [Stutzerimonas nosocomialis]TLX65100.1 hypothetical protein DN820_01965 [Stutzerimonas nosocomialis]
MDFTLYQVLAFIGSFAGILIVAALGYYEGRHAQRKKVVSLRQAWNEENELWRHRLQRAQYEHNLSRLNAAQALEAITADRDAAEDTAAGLRLQLITAKQRAANAPHALREEDAEDLAAMAGKLSLAATTFAQMGAIDQATTTRALALKARNLSERYYAAQPATTQPEGAAA